MHYQLLNREEIMGEKKAGFWLNAGLWATLIFALITSYSAVLGLIDTLKGLFN